MGGALQSVGGAVKWAESERGRGWRTATFVVSKPENPITLIMSTSSSVFPSSSASEAANHKCTLTANSDYQVATSNIKTWVDTARVCYVLLRLVTSCHVLSRLVTSCHVLSRLVTFCYVLLRFVTFCYILLRFVTFCYVLLRFVTFCYVLLRFVTFRSVFQQCSS